MLHNVLVWVTAQGSYFVHFGVATLLTMMVRMLERMLFRRDLHRKLFWSSSVRLITFTEECCWNALFLHILGWQLETAVVVMPVLYLINWFYSRVMFLIHWNMVRCLLGCSVALLAEWYLRHTRIPEGLLTLASRLMMPLALGLLAFSVQFILASLLWRVNPTKTRKHLAETIAKGIADGKITEIEISWIEAMWLRIRSFFLGIWLFIFDVGGSHFFAGGELIKRVTFWCIPLR